MFGPRRILQVSAVPGLASWLLVALGSASLAALLMSRIMAGLSFGLLSGNVFLVHTASGDNLASLKMVEVSTSVRVRVVDIGLRLGFDYDVCCVVVSTQCVLHIHIHTIRCPCVTH